MDYPHKLPPFAHQLDEFESTRDVEARALFWEMGTGKTKPTIDTIAWLYMQGEITGALVLAPKGVAPNWVHDELPAHLPDEVAAKTRVLMWQGQRVGTQKYQRELSEALAHDGLLILCMSYDGIMTGTPGRAFKVKNIRRAFKGCHLAKQMLISRRCIMVLDESARIKNPNAKRTKRVQAAGLRAPFRRILTGTPVANSPFDLYSQVRFLDPHLWHSIGCASFEAFKSRFGVWIEHVRNDNGQCFKKLVDYQNLSDLHEVAERVGSRLLKDDVLDLPPKLYEKRYFSLGKEQQKLYDDMRRDFMILLEDGDMVTAPLVITQLLRLQQITSGYCPTDDGNMLLMGDNPRLGCLLDTVEDTICQCIIWSKFQTDIDLIAEALSKKGKSFVIYDGRVKSDDREERRRTFKQGKVQFFLANPAAGGEGLTLSEAKVVIYYNTTYKLSERLQSEDRAHRIGQDVAVTYIDIVAAETVDDKIIRALRAKANLASQVLGDKWKEWI